MNINRLKHIVTTTIVLLLIAIVFGWPLVTGVILKTAFPPTLEALSEPNRWSLHEGEFTRGWFNSEARSILTLEGDFAQQAHDAHLSNSQLPFQVTLIHHIQHGPLLGMGRPSMLPALALIETTVEFPGEIQERLHNIFSGAAAIHLKTLFQWDGSIITRVESPTAQGIIKSGTKMNWRGMAGTLEISPERDIIKGEIAMPLLELINDAGRLTLEQFGIHLDTSRHPSGIWLGDIGCDFQTFAFTIPAKPEGNLLFSGMHAASISQAQGNTFHAQVSLDLDQISLAGQNFNSGGFTAELQRVDLTAFANLYQELKALEQQTIINSSQDEKLKQIIIKHLPELIRHSPEVGISRFALKTPQGIIDAKFRLTLDGKNNLPLNIFNPVQLSQNLDALIEINSPSALITDLLNAQIMREIMAAEELQKNNPDDLRKLAQIITEQRLAVLIAQGLLISENDRYRTQIKFSQGQLEVNSHPRNELLNLLRGTPN